MSAEPIISEFADDPDMTELVELFVDRLGATMGEMRAALSAGEFDEVQRLAHQLKGAAAGYGFPGLGEAARVVESSFQRGGGLVEPMSELERRVSDLVSLSERVAA